MKRIYHILIAALAAMSLFVSCRKHDIIPDPEPEEESVEYKITSTETISDFDSFIKSKTSGADMIYALVMNYTSIKALIKEKFTIKDLPVRVIRYNYQSLDPQGEEVTLSALMTIPEQAFNGESTKGIFLYNHGSYTCEAQCGSEQNIFEMMITWMNYVFVAADYYGFGVTASSPQAYLNPTVAAHASLDAYKAAVQILKDFKVSYGDKVYNGGYSQGGFNSICNEKYLAEHPNEDISFTKTFAGGGSYDVPGTYNQFLIGNYPAGTIFAVSSIVAMNETEHLGFPYSSLLKGKVLENYEDWFLSKKYRNAEITKLMGSTEISDHLAEDILAKRGEAFNTIWKVCTSYSLVTGNWAPKAGSNINLYHMDSDDCVPYTNMTALRDHFSSVSTAKSIVTYNDLQNVELPSDLKTAVATIRKYRGQIEMYSSVYEHVIGAIVFFYDLVATEL